MTDEEFTAFVRARAGELQRAARLLTGDWALAEDLARALAALRTMPEARDVRTAELS